MLDVFYRSEGFPLTGIFHPWAQWDMGLDTLENSSAAAVAPSCGQRGGGGEGGMEKYANFLMLSLKSIFLEK